MAAEIERKFLVGEVPDLPRFARPRRLSQHYLARTDGLELRIRQIGRKHWLTIKTGDGLERQEHEIMLSPRQYDSLRSAGTGSHIEKLRYRIPVGKRIAELDVYIGELAGLKVVEVEFPDTAAAEDFDPPYWFGPEVTDDRYFSNANLASLSREAARQYLGTLLDPPSVSYGAIPVIRTEGQIQVVTVSTKSRSRWIFPKGTPEHSKLAQTVASNEALEEAGVEGPLVGPPITVGYWRDRQYLHIDYWPMDVKTLWNHWDEDTARQRIVCPAADAPSYLANPSFIRALDKALAQIAAL